MYQPRTQQSPNSQPHLQKAVEWHVSSAQISTRSPGPGKGLGVGTSGQGSRSREVSYISGRAEMHFNPLERVMGIPLSWVASAEENQGLLLLFYHLPKGEVTGSFEPYN